MIGSGASRVRTRASAWLITAVVGIGAVALGSTGAVSATTDAGARADRKAPTVAIAQPDFEAYNPATIAGSATDNKGVKKVRISLRRGDNNKYFNGTSWQRKPVWLKATLKKPGARSTSWSAGFTLPDVYVWVEAQSIDTSGNVSNTVRSSFQMKDPPDLSLASMATNPVTLTAGATGAFVNVQTFNIGEAQYTRRVTVKVTLPDFLTVTAGSGDGWTCVNAAHTATCRTDADVPGGGATPSFAVYFDVSAEATTPATITAAITAAGQADPTNDSRSIDVEVALPR